MAQPKDFGFDSDAQMLQASARKFWKEHSPVEKLRALVARDPDPGRAPAAPFDRAAWDKLVALGWTALAVPDCHFFPVRILPGTAQTVKGSEF